MEVPIGQCTFCNKKQMTIGKEGYWIFYMSDIKWICHKCKNEKNIRSYPVACEWCKYDHVKWHQGHSYNCPRCDALGIKHL